MKVERLKMAESLGRQLTNRDTTHVLSRKYRPLELPAQTRGGSTKKQVSMLADMKTIVADTTGMPEEPLGLK